MKDTTLWRRIAARLSVGGVFRTKPVEELKRETEEPGQQLRRELGPVQLTLFGIGAIIGAGIFATIGTAAAGDAQRPGAGPALMLSFVLTAVVCGFTALCYAEFASMVPISGSAYTYAYASLGELIAWIIGWDLIIEYAVGNIAVAISWGNYFKTFVQGFGLHIPDWLSMDYRTAAKADAVTAAGDKILLASGEVAKVIDIAPHIFGVPIVINVLAVGIVGLITLLLIVGIRESAWFNAIMVGIKIVVLTFFIVVGSFWVQPSNYTPFAPNGWHGISAGAAVVFFAYIGFDAVSTVAEETRNPQRNMPIGIMASLVICTLFYVVVSIVFTGLIGYDELRRKLATEQAEPLTMALQYAMAAQPAIMKWAVGIVAFGSVVAHTAVLLVFQMGQPRIFLAMARDGLLPPMFARVHPYFRTPALATILTGIFVSVFSAFASIDEMVDLTNIGTLFAFILVCAGIVVLRYKEPDRPRPFRVAGGPVLPVLGVLSCLYLVYYLPPTSWLRFAAWLNVGFVIYVGYGAIHSRLTGRQLVDATATPPDPTLSEAIQEQPGPQPSTATLGQHDAATARTGLWLALLGVALLLLLHGVDLGLAELAQREHGDVADRFAVVLGAPGLAELNQSKYANESIGVRMGAMIREALRPGAWLKMQNNFGDGWLWLLKDELFWFLLLPLAINAFILCPIVIRRALRAEQLARPADTGARPRRSLIGAAVLMAVIAGYFVLLYVNNRG